jgi:hypothetical protein
VSAIESHHGSGGDQFVRHLPEPKGYSKMEHVEAVSLYVDACESRGIYAEQPGQNDSEDANGVCVLGNLKGTLAWVTYPENEVFFPGDQK